MRGKWVFVCFDILDVASRILVRRASQIENSRLVIRSRQIFDIALVEILMPLKIKEKIDVLDIKKQTKLSIAICGIRGIPACYGGFETFAEELAPRLVKLGHDVTVFGRRHVISFKENHYKGVRIRLLSTIRNKYLETPLHTLVCILDMLCLRARGYCFDVILVCNAANSPVIWLARLFGFRVVVNVDGIERMRAKWNMLGRIWYRIGERCSVWFANHVISDAKVIQEYYKGAYNADSIVIPYGCIRSEDDRVDKKLLGLEITWGQREVLLFSELGVRPYGYILYVSRLEPENNAHVVIDAYSQLTQHERDQFPLVIVGDAPYAKDYIANLKKLACREVIFAGYRFGDAYRTLQLGAYFYVQATEVGGTHPALVEAMGFGNCVISNKTPENEEVLGECGVLYLKNDVSDLNSRMSTLINAPDNVFKWRKKALERARATYDWAKITQKYEDLFLSLVVEQRKNKP